MILAFFIEKNSAFLTWNTNSVGDLERCPVQIRELELYKLLSGHSLKHKFVFYTKFTLTCITDNITDLGKMVVSTSKSGWSSLGVSGSSLISPQNPNSTPAKHQPRSAKHRRLRSKQRRETTKFNGYKLEEVKNCLFFILLVSSSNSKVTMAKHSRVLRCKFRICRWML